MPLFIVLQILCLCTFEYYLIYLLTILKIDFDFPIKTTTFLPCGSRMYHYFILLLNNISLYEYTIFYLSTYQFGSIWKITNNVTMNIYIQVFVWTLKVFCLLILFNTGQCKY